jgi:hypothetical protein
MRRSALEDAGIVVEAAVASARAREFIDPDPFHIV